MSEEIIANRRDFDLAMREVMTGEEPSPESLARAARAFDTLVRSCLHHAGWSCSASTVANLLGEDPSNYSRARRGFALSRHRLLGWIGKWVLISSSGSDVNFPVFIRSPRADLGDSKHRPPGIHTLEPASYPDKLSDQEEDVSFEVFVRTKRRIVFHGEVLRSHYEE